MATPKKIHEFREQWLREALDGPVTELFKQHGYKLPPKIRVTAGWPSRNALGRRKRTIGQAWSPSASKDGTAEIIISLYLADPVTVLATLIHEVVHVVVGNDHGHDKVFGKCARAVGLEGKLTATTPSKALAEDILRDWSPRLGKYPHAELDGLEKTKSQTTRLIKLECPACGCVIRTTEKWLELYEDGWTCPCGTGDFEREVKE
jgi:hypothetical protein